LSFIKDYYQSNVAGKWGLYYKTGRNILATIAFHISANMFNEIFRTHPDGKLIQTGLLIIFCAVILIKDRKFFFDKKTEIRRQELIAAARALMSEDRRGNATMESIVQNLGIAKGTLYPYFRSKEELLEAIVESLVDESVQAKTIALEGPKLSPALSKTFREQHPALFRF